MILQLDSVSSSHAYALDSFPLEGRRTGFIKVFESVKMLSIS
jgi:hypothetical protein